MSVLASPTARFDSMSSRRYFILTAVQTAYAYWVEDKTIYVGKRRTLANRVSSSLAQPLFMSSTLDSPSTDRNGKTDNRVGN